MKKKVLISACLLGKNCRYSGGHSHIKELDDLNVDFIPVCPEEAGGLETPRPAAELLGSAKSILSEKGSIITNDGHDVTQNFIHGAKKSLEKGLTSSVEYAILKSNSPSCGVGAVYDGTFTNSLTNGDGIFAYLCTHAGINCIPSDDLNKIKKTLQKQK